MVQLHCKEYCSQTILVLLYYFQCKKCSVNGTTTVGAASGKKKNLLLENGESVECVEEFCYLGDIPSCGGGAV